MLSDAQKHPKENRVSCFYIRTIQENIKDTLGEVLEKNNKTQIRIAETEKYPHVTFFFNGGREKPFKNEKRILCPSPKVATYDLQPEMSANEVKDSIVSEINKKGYVSVDKFIHLCQFEEKGYYLKNVPKVVFFMKFLLVLSIDLKFSDFNILK